VRSAPLILALLFQFPAPVQADGSLRDEESAEESSAEESEGVSGEDSGAESPPVVLAPWQWMERCWAAKKAGDVAGARAALASAGAAGADPQLVSLETAYLDLLEGDRDSARSHLEDVKQGPDPELVAAAEAQLAQIQEDNLEEVFAEPPEEAQGPQYKALKAAYAALESEDFAAARKHLLEAKRGEDEGLAEQARSELRYLPKSVWADAYLEGFGWVRFTEPRSENLVPTFRLRGFLHPLPKVDLDPYIFVQVSRDISSRAEGPEGYPLIYADNHLMLGGGLQFRFWKKRVGLFAQAGPAFSLVRSESTPLVEPDVRVGAFFSLLVPNCHPEPQKRGVRKERAFCADIYSEAVYVSRFDHNLLAILRARVLLTYLMTGPVAWEPYVEGRILKDIRNDYWNNLADAGVGHRWRLVGPIALHVMVGVHGGGYFGLQNVDPAPSDLGYAEFRVQIGGYAAF